MEIMVRIEHLTGLQTKTNQKINCLKEHLVSAPNTCSLATTCSQDRGNSLKNIHVKLISVEADSGIVLHMPLLIH